MWRPTRWAGVHPARVQTPPLSATSHRQPNLRSHSPQLPGPTVLEDQTKCSSSPSLGGEGGWEVQLVFWEAQLTPLSRPHSPATCRRDRGPSPPAWHLPAAGITLPTQPLSLSCWAQH